MSHGIPPEPHPHASPPLALLCVLLLAVAAAAASLWLRRIGTEPAPVDELCEASRASQGLPPLQATAPQERLRTLADEIRCIEADAEVEAALYRKTFGSKEAEFHAGIMMAEMRIADRLRKLPVAAMPAEEATKKDASILCGTNYVTNMTMMVCASYTTNVNWKDGGSPIIMKLEYKTSPDDSVQTDGGGK